MKLRLHPESDSGWAVKEFWEQTLPAPQADPSPNLNPEDLCSLTVLAGVQPQGQRLTWEKPPERLGD